MLFFGHIAATLLIADATDSDRTAAVAGNLLPDVTDKTLSWVLKLTPSRWLAHGLPAYAVVNLLAFFVLDRRRWRGFALGYLGHLVCDLWAGGKVPWLAPFRKTRGKKKHEGVRFWAVFLIPEVIGLPLTVHILAETRGPRPQTDLEKLETADAGADP